MESSQDIPYEKVILMEKLFDLQQSALAYQHQEVESLKSMLIDDLTTTFSSSPRSSLQTPQ